ncbi:MAG: hypothetical protein B6D64_02135 [Bacteroidetes bacterium 4484_276]|nr:MAG: hypothetical protein B6D64_02135 [Bacteroidetes bacterium 4484_276]
MFHAGWFLYAVRGSSTARPKHSEGGLRQPPPTNKNYSRLPIPKAFGTIGINKLPLQSLPQQPHDKHISKNIYFLY